MQPQKQQYCQLGLTTLFILSGTITNQSAFAQLTPDNTLGAESSIVNQIDLSKDRIEGGATRGSNLFHSFQEFNVNTGKSVYFANPTGIENILTRVTGGNVSNILGKLGIEGTANLFLINPHGIYFGNGASLDIKGSFTATTADSIKLGEDGLFSATNPQSSNLLSVQPGALFTNAIQNQTSQIRNEGNLQVDEGKNITFFSANLINTGGLTAPGGIIQLTGTENININGSSAIINVRAGGGGSIEVNAGNLEMREGSQFLAGIGSGLGTPDAQAGDITINVTDSIKLLGDSRISASTFGTGNAGIIKITASDVIKFDNSDVFSQVNPGAVGNAGGVEISTKYLELVNDSGLNASTFGKGDAGTVKITADVIKFDNSNVFSRVRENAVGNAGGVEISTKSLELLNSSFLDASTLGKGNAGTVKITASDVIKFDGNSHIFSQVAPGAVGNAGGVEISTKYLELLNSSFLDASTLAKGDAGTVKITADVIKFDNSNVFSQVNPGAVGNAGGVEISTKYLELVNGSELDASTFGKGDAGTVKITASDTIKLDKNSNVDSRVEEGGVGNAGGVEIFTKYLEMLNSSRISASTFGTGDAGTVKITASDVIKFDNSDVFSRVGKKGVGNSGGMEISTKYLELVNGSELNASTLGKGDAGIVKITASDVIKFDNGDLFSQVTLDAVGNAGGVEISTKSLELLNDSRLDASTLGKGNAGTVKITASDVIKFDNSDVFSQVTLDAVGNAGGVEISTKSLELLNGSRFSASTFGKGDAGTVKITASNMIKLSDSNVFSQVGKKAVGNAGGVEISTKSLELLNGSELDASTFGKGDAGIIKITAADVIQLDKNSNVDSRVEEGGVGNAGGVEIFTKYLEMLNSSRISASTLGQGNAGTVKITASNAIKFDSSSIFSRVAEGGVGNAGTVTIFTNFLELLNSSTISAATDDKGKGGNIQINANDFKTESGGKLITTTSAAGQAGTIILKIKDNLYLTGEDTGIFANTTKGSTGAGGSIDIDPITMLIENGASIKVDSQGTGIAGNIKIETGNLTLNNRGTISAETFGGEGGNITLNVAKDIRLRNNSLISAEAGNAGNGGNININAGGFVLAFLNENSDIVANAFAGTGGTVTGKAVGIFGFRRFVKERTPESDFIASSKLGIDGIVSIETNQLNLPKLPPDFVNVESLNKDVCAIKDDKIAGGSSFIITGKGGLPLDSHELISNSPAFVEWENISETVTQASNSSVKVTPKNTNHAQKIQQAQGWIIGENGKVILTADSQKVTLQTDKNNLPDCK